MAQVLVSNDKEPVGVVMVTLPIPDGDYSKTINGLREMGIGDVRARDCYIGQIMDAPPVLDCLEGQTVNIDELDFLFRSIDRYTDDELAEFQAVAAKREITDIENLINLSFCSERATVITNFDDLEIVGRRHYMTMQAQYDSVELFGIPALFTNSRLDRTTIPSGWHCYDVRGSDYDPGSLSTLEPYVLVNHAGSILSLQPIPFPEGQDYVKIRGKINFDDDPEDMLTKFRESCRQMKTVDSANAEIDKPESVQENEGSGNSAPLRIKNLAELKRLIKPGTEIRATYHSKHPEIVGLTRVVTTVKTNCFYSKIKDHPEHKYSIVNHGMGFRSDFQKAGMYKFNGSSITVVDPDSTEPKVLYEMEVYAPQMSMAEQNNTMRMEMM